MPIIEDKGYFKEYTRTPEERKMAELETRVEELEEFKANTTKLEERIKNLEESSKTKTSTTSTRKPRTSKSKSTGGELNEEN